MPKNISDCLEITLIRYCFGLSQPMSLCLFWPSWHNFGDIVLNFAFVVNF